MTKDKSTATITLSKGEVTSVLAVGIWLGVCITSLAFGILVFLTK